MDPGPAPDAPREGTARAGGPSLSQPLRIVTRCKTVDDFIASFRRLVDERYMLVALRVPRPAGSMLRFSVQLADGTPVFQGVGRVVDVYEPREGRASAGVKVELVVLDEESRTMHLRLLVARTPSGNAIRPPPPPSPAPPPVSAPEAVAGDALPMDVHQLASVLPARPARPPAIATESKAKPPRPPKPPPLPPGALAVPPAPPVALGIEPAAAPPAPEPELDPHPDLDAPTNVDPLVVPAHLAELAAAATGAAPPLAAAPPAEVVRVAGVSTAASAATGAPARPARTPMPASMAEPTRTPGAELQLPANPLGELSPEALEQFVECTIYEDVAPFAPLSHPAPPFTQPAPPPIDQAVVALAAAASPAAASPDDGAASPDAAAASPATVAAPPTTSPRLRTVNPAQRTGPVAPARSHLGLVLAAAMVAAVVGVAGGYLLWGRRAAPELRGVPEPAAASPAADR